MEELIDCIIHRQQGFIYVVAQKRPNKDNYFFDAYFNLHECKSIIEGHRHDFAETEKGLEFELGVYSGVKWIVGTTDPILIKDGVAKCPNLYHKLDMIKVKMEKYGFHTVLEGGIDLGVYGYHLRPVLTGTGSIITSF